MGLVAIRNGLVATFTACGPFAANEISTCDFGIMESVSGSCIILSPKRVRPEAMRAGTPPSRGYKRTWTISGTLYIKWSDPTRMLSQAWQGMDDIYNTISKDDTLQSSACAAQVSDISFDKRFTVRKDGNEYLPIEFEIEAEEGY